MQELIGQFKLELQIDVHTKSESYIQIK